MDRTSCLRISGILALPRTTSILDRMTLLELSPVPYLNAFSSINMGVCPLVGGDPITNFYSSSILACLTVSQTPLVQRYGCEEKTRSCSKSRRVKKRTHCKNAYIMDDATEVYRLSGAL